MTTPPDIDALREALLYCPLTGLFWWKWRDDVPKHVNSRWAGKPALTARNAKGYRVGTFRRKEVRAHRVAYAISHGVWVEHVDHHNGVTDDNRYLNLKASDAVANGRNKRKSNANTSGVTGVSWHKSNRKWRADIRVNCKHIHLGYFTDKADAITARRAAEAQYGFDPLHGRSDAVRAARNLTERKGKS